MAVSRSSDLGGQRTKGYGQSGGKRPAIPTANCAVESDAEAGDGNLGQPVGEVNLVDRVDVIGHCRVTIAGQKNDHWEDIVGECLTLTHSFDSQDGLRQTRNKIRRSARI